MKSLVLSIIFIIVLSGCALQPGANVVKPIEIKVGAVLSPFPGHGQFGSVQPVGFHDFLQGRMQVHALYRLLVFLVWRLHVFGPKSIHAGGSCNTDLPAGNSKGRMRKLCAFAFIPLLGCRKKCW